MDNSHQGRVRGQTDISLSPEGIQDMKDWGKTLRRLGPVHQVFYSDLIRDDQSAHLLARPSHALCVPMGDSLRPQGWGYLEGWNKDKAKPIQDSFNNQPTVRPRGGESLVEAASRYLPALLSILRASRNSRNVLVAHGSNIQLMNAWFSAGAKRSWELNLPGLGLRISPCVGFFVNPDDYLTVPPLMIYQETTAPLTNGLILIRHGRTNWSDTNYKI